MPHLTEERHTVRTGSTGPAQRVRLSSLPGLLLGLLLGLLSLGVETAMASNRNDPSVICDVVASEAAARTGVPVSVLKAITLTETGRARGGQTRPWPWTVNMEGKGVWFDTADAARAYAYEHFKRGARSFDVGCFQINYKWHHQAFASLEEMFDPMVNALYAAKFLAELHAETGSWEAAAGAYHSRTPEYADRYKARFATFRAQHQAEDSMPLAMRDTQTVAALLASAGGEGGESFPAVAATTRPRVNTFPLLQGGGDSGLGSLVPLGANGSARSLFAPDDAG